MVEEMKRLLTILFLITVAGLLTPPAAATPLKDHKKSSRRETVRKTKVRSTRTMSRREARISTRSRKSRTSQKSRMSRKTQAIQAAWMGVTLEKKTGPEDKTESRITAAFIQSKGRLPWPVSGATVTHGFGSYRLMPGIRANNRGITLAAEPGTAVTAVAEGKVESVFPEVDAVIIRHGKYFTVYSDLSDISVHPGDDICEGDLLGRVGESRQIDFWLSDDQVRYEDPQHWLRTDKDFSPTDVRPVSYDRKRL